MMAKVVMPSKDEKRRAVFMIKGIGQNARLNNREQQELYNRFLNESPDKRLDMLFDIYETSKRQNLIHIAFIRQQLNK
jgi:hypothetical protein